MGDTLLLPAISSPIGEIANCILGLLCGESIFTGDKWSMTTSLLIAGEATATKLLLFFGGDIERFTRWLDGYGDYLLTLIGDSCRLAGENYFLAGDFVAERIGDWWIGDYSNLDCCFGLDGDALEF